MPAETPSASPSLNSQCAVCGTALTGPFSFFARLAGIRRSARNLSVCNRCNSHIQAGRLSEITIMFADLSSFTQLTQQMGAEKTHAIVDVFLKMATEILQRHGATIDKYVGDAVMAWFNVPVPQPDHAMRALQSAMDMQACMPLIEREQGVKLQVAVGISTGWAFVGQLGSRNQNDFTVIGDSVNLAARLQGTAGPGQVVMSEGVYDAVRDVLKDVREEMVMLKGFPDPMRTYRVGSPNILPRRVEPPPERKGTKTPYSLGGMIFAVLGAPCAVATLISPVALYLGAGWLFGSMAMFGWIDDRWWLRFPLLAMATAMAGANLFILHKARFIRRQTSTLPTALEKRQTFWLTLISFATLLFVLAELVLHPIYNHTFF